MAIQKESLVNIVIERIKEHIMTNQLKTNDKLATEKELTEQLAVSRTVVREALISLQSIGILTIKSSGVYINNPSYSIRTILKHHYETHGVKIKELVEIRKVIELGALQLIMEKENPVDFHYLNTINHSYFETIRAKQDTRKYDRLFHQYLMKATQNETYFEFAEIINEYFSLTKIDWVEKEAALIESYHQHEKIIDCLKENDLPKARGVITEHFAPIFQFVNQMEAEHGTH